MIRSTSRIAATAWLAAGLSLCLSAAASAGEWFAAADGTPQGAGTRESPWDLAGALGGAHKIEPGDTLWLRGGTYRRPFKVLDYGFEVRLAGRPGAPVQIRAVPGERVTIDGGLLVKEPSTYLWIRDLEITVSHPRPAGKVPPDPTYRVVNRPWGGLNVYAGTGCKYINLVIHDNCQGVSFWKEAVDSELYGCILYDNGWEATDRGHGHAVYTQNDQGVKTIADCIMTGGFGYTLHAYGSDNAFVNNYLAEGNIVYEAGGPFLIGGGRPSTGIRVFRNFLYRVPLRLGYGSTENEDCEVRENLVVGPLQIGRFRKAVAEDNLVLPEDAARPGGTRVVLRPNRYDPDRAHLAVFNWDRKPVVEVPAGELLKRGERFRLLNPRDFWGKPVLAGEYDGRALRVPLAGEFGAFVLLRER